MKINQIDTDEQVFIVAEIGNNHEGDFDVAQELIRQAAIAGADAVKFQTFVPELYVSSEDQERLERLRKFQFSFEQFHNLKKFAKVQGIIFFSTPFDLVSAEELNKFQSLFKVSSGDNTYIRLLQKVASFKKPTIVSSGLASVKDLELVCKIWSDVNAIKKLAILHCVSSYPVPIEEANLLAISELKKVFPDIVIGYSDHTLGIQASCSAVAIGARIIEKHFTLDKNYSDFRDHQLSADPSEMKDLVEQIRIIEKSLGGGQKTSQQSELGNLTAVRRSRSLCPKN
jgi:Sialic acid synthase